MNGNVLKDLADSKSAVESVKRLRPSSLFICILILAVPFIIRFLFENVTGYDYMVWIWFSLAGISTAIAIIAYSVDMAAFTKRNNYEKLEN